MFLKSLAALAVGIAVGFSAPVMAQESFKVGVTTTGVPFTFVDTTTQQPTGAMVDLAKAIATEVGLKPTFELTAFSALVPSLSTHKIDVISAGMLATDERRKVVDFSEPVYTYGDAMFVAADAKDVTLDDLKGQVVGAQVGTTFADSLKALNIFSEVKLYESIADIMRDVKLGRIKAGFGDQPIIAYQIAKNPGLGVRLVKGYKPLKEGQVALAIAKDNPALLTKVNAAILKLKASGELDKIFAAYGL
ncbi:MULTISPECIES: ABC transporter substrate-binding protein [Azorhizobium]|nr:MULTISPECIES: ABC transporter substrate-binding protein [Azorhizobium]TDT99275.1 amino acid ABC transporter substrate-binding protein (PAAT family) [Azorhizobium sp. AG788]